MKVLDRLKARMQLKYDYQAVFETPRGQAVLEHLCKVGFVTTSTIHPDPNVMQQREGMRHLVLSILNQVNKPESEVIRLIAQQQQEESQHEE